MRKNDGLKRFKIKYQHGNDICLTINKARDEIAARYEFHMTHGTNDDIIDVEEIAEDETNDR